MFKVSIPQKKLILGANQNENLMDFLIKNNLPVASSCHGEGLCSKCSMKITPEGIRTEQEIKTLQKNNREPNERLCCQVFINQDLTVHCGYW